jgi:hypothetical protein
MTPLERELRRAAVKSKRQCLASAHLVSRQNASQASRPCDQLASVGRRRG